MSEITVSLPTVTDSISGAPEQDDAHLQQSAALPAAVDLSQKKITSICELEERIKAVL